MFSMSSLDHTPCRSGSPHGVRGAVYSTDFPANAVTTSGGDTARPWPDTVTPAHTQNVTIPATALTDAISRVLIVVRILLSRSNRTKPPRKPSRTTHPPTTNQLQ